MSWQAYVDTSMVGTGHVDKGAIYSLAGDSKWAGSAGFEVSPTELKGIISGFKDADPLWQNGLHIAGERYVLTKAEDSKRLYARKGRDGVVIVKTAQAILISHYNEHMQAGNCATTVENLADYLVGLGY